MARYDYGAISVISDDEKDAKTKDPNLKLTHNDLIFLLESNNIRFGVDFNLIEHILTKPDYDNEYKIAIGLAPIPGVKASIKASVNINSIEEFETPNNEKINFDFISKLTKVQSGTTLLEVSPGKTGKTGKNIHGWALQPQMGEDIPFPKLSNTEITEDNLRMVTKKPGYIYKMQDTYHFLELFEIGDNIEYPNRNLNFEGDVYIKGDINNGFKVKAEGNRVNPLSQF